MTKACHGRVVVVVVTALPCDRLLVWGGRGHLQRGTLSGMRCASMLAPNSSHQRREARVDKNCGACSRFVRVILAQGPC